MWRVLLTTAAVVAGMLTVPGGAQADDGGLVSAGRQHTCAIDTAGSISCWGRNAFSEVFGPDSAPGAFSEVVAGQNSTCAVRDEPAADIRCDGHFAQASVRLPDQALGSYTSVSMGVALTCALDSARSISCWGDEPLASHVTDPDTAAGTFQEISVGGTRTCALGTDGAITCWGLPGPPAGTYRSITTAGDHACALDAGDSITCWGTASAATTGPDAAGGTFREVSTGRDTTCAIDSAYQLRCWGVNQDPPGGTFGAVSVGDDHACAINWLGKIACWGADDWGQTSGPNASDETFALPGAVPAPPDPDRTLTVTTHSGSGRGSVRGPGISCSPFSSGDCTETYPHGTPVTLEVESVSGDSYFVSFGGAGCTTSPCRLTLTGDVAVDAIFDELPAEADRRRLTVSLSGVGTGAVTGAGIACGWGAGDDCSTTVAAGTTVALTAGPSALTSSAFATFTGGGCTTSPCTLTVDDDTTVDASFDVPDPVALTGAATDVTGTTATLNASVDPHGVATSYGFEYGTSTSFGHLFAPFEAGDGTTLEAQPGQVLTGLEPNTTYVFRVAAWRGTDPQVLGQVRTFTTGGPPTAPAADTTSASQIIPTTWRARGTVNPHGQATAYVVEYGLTTDFGSISLVGGVGSGTAGVPVSADLFDLARGATYFYRVVATNATGTTAGPVRTFTTAPAAGSTPGVLTGAAGDLTPTGATLNGFLHPFGVATAFTFELGTSTSFGSITAVDWVSSDPTIGRPVSLPVSGLSPGTTYLFRLVATNTTGTTIGDVMSFTTPPET